MFVTNVVLADQQTKEKIWKLPNGSVFFGDVEVRVYKNEYFLSFIDSC
jgi:hypothetical protein